MKLATFDLGDGPRIGLVSQGDVIDLTAAHPGMPRTMIDLIAAWPDVRAQIEAAASAALPRFALDQVKLLAPVPRPGKILAIGLNYTDHIKETGRETPTQQVWFGKLTSAVNGPYADIEVPASSSFVDYEAELVVVIGKAGRNIAAADAFKHVFGFCCGNDVTARDWQRSSPQWLLGKSFDTHAPFGPWITTTDEIATPPALAIRALVNGEVRQNSNTDKMVFPITDQIAHISRAMTLEPGDVIFTGTPAGVGHAMNPPVSLKDGDVVRIEIDGLGALEARMKAV